MSANEYENYQSNSNTSSTTDSNSGDLDDKTLLEEYQKATLRNVNSQNKKNLQELYQYKMHTIF